jgi:peptidoglycan biosynthesis protein MviN/MurJ (putative lipid II flippase)
MTTATKIAEGCVTLSWTILIVAATLNEWMSSDVALFLVTLSLGIGIMAGVTGVIAIQEGYSWGSVTSVLYGGLVLLVVLVLIWFFLVSPAGLDFLIP